MNKNLKQSSAVFSVRLNEDQQKMVNELTPDWMNWSASIQWCIQEAWIKKEVEQMQKSNKNTN